MLLWSGLLLAQTPDFYVDQLQVPAGYRLDPQRESVQASTRLYSNGESLSLYVEVYDPQLALHASPERCDHVELWLALPEQAYPSDFAYALHPQYVYTPLPKSRGERAPEGNGGPRMFSLFMPQAEALTPQALRNRHGYPDDNRISQQGLEVPPAHSLRSDEIHLGIVRIALFPDGRPPRLLNREALAPMEQRLNLRLGDLLDGINYTAQPNERNNGYYVDAQIDPRAFGLISLPNMEHFRMMVDVLSTDRPGELARLVRTTAPQRIASRPSTFNEVRLFQPLRTNVTTLPDAYFRQARFFPLYLFSATGWEPVQVDVDALVYREQSASASVSELGLFRMPLHYERGNFRGTNYSRLTVDRFFVNEVPKREEYLFVEGQLIKTGRMRDLRSIPTQLPEPLFRFPDGSLGVIVRDNVTADPWGWGSCGYCLEEQITFLQVRPQHRPQELLHIKQGDGPYAYCQVGTFNYPDFFVSQVDWIREGEILVLRLRHRVREENRRIKVSWDSYGRPLVEEAP